MFLNYPLEGKAEFEATFSYILKDFNSLDFNYDDGLSQGVAIWFLPNQPDVDNIENVGNFIQGIRGDFHGLGILAHRFTNKDHNAKNGD